MDRYGGIIACDLVVVRVDSFRYVRGCEGLGERCRAAARAAALGCEP